MEITPSSLPWQSVYKILVGSVIPRPIGWISTLSADGRRNLGPYSFFNVAGANPPHVLFCPMIRVRDCAEKDSLRNCRETGEFVVNIVIGPLVEAMNLTSGEYPQEIDEFDLAKLTPVPSVIVKPPRVAESPIHYECKVVQIIDLGDQPGAGSVIIGRVEHIHVADEYLIGGDKIDISKLNAVGRLAGNGYARVTDIFDLERP